MKSIPKMASVMTPFPYSIDIEGSVVQALQIMQEHDVRHLPVMKDGRPTSIITQSEINFVLAQVKGTPKADSMKVSEVCALQAYIVSIDEHLDTVLTTMIENHIGSAIVVKNDRLAGIFTMVDACLCLRDFLRKQAGYDEPDDTVA